MFKEGSDVKAGQTLFRIDEAPRGGLDSAKANLAKAEANLAQTQAQLERYRPLVEANAISKQDFVNAEAAVKQSQADVASTKAAVRTAGINGYATVTAPISGRIGRAPVTEGALVGQGEATLWLSSSKLTLSTSTSPNLPTTFFSCAKPWPAANSSVRGGQDAASVRLILNDGTEYEHPGKLLFSDLTVDSTTGQITLRAEVPNPKGELLPGLYLRVKLEQAQASNAIPFRSRP